MCVMAPWKRPRKPVAYRTDPRAQARANRGEGQVSPSLQRVGRPELVSAFSCKGGDLLCLHPLEERAHFDSRNWPTLAERNSTTLGENFGLDRAKLDTVPKASVWGRRQDRPRLPHHQHRSLGKHRGGFERGGGCRRGIVARRCRCQRDKGQCAGERADRSAGLQGHTIASDQDLTAHLPGQRRPLGLGRLPLSGDGSGYLGWKPPRQASVR